MKTLVFLGPTLAATEARAILEATYLPPVTGGDVYAALREDPDVICIIDGCFEQAPSVRHKEILFALSFKSSRHPTRGPPRGWTAYGLSPCPRLIAMYPDPLTARPALTEEIRTTRSVLSKS